MKITNQRTINTFFHTINLHLKTIDSLKVGLYKKLLFVSLIDALSNIRYPKETNNHVKFVSFLDNYSDWADKNKVSIVQLYLFLKKIIRKKGNSLLYGFVIKQIESRLIYDDIEKKIFVNNDPPIFQLRKLAKKGERKAVELSRYSELFYIYRNKLIHNFIEAGSFGFSSTGEDYDGFLSQAYTSGVFSLFFPTGLFKFLCQSSLKNLKNYLLENDINPEKEFRDEEIFMWIDSNRLKRLKKTESNNANALWAKIKKMRNRGYI